jgi:hypothetical protein
MKLFRKFLRYWIGFASLLSFLGGWVILAHSPKPVLFQSSSPAALPPSTLTGLPTIQAYGSTTDTGLTFFSTPVPSTNPQPIQPVQPGQAVPLLRTRGS